MKRSTPLSEKLIRVSMFSGKVMGVLVGPKIRPKMNKPRDFGELGDLEFVASLRKSMTAGSVFTLIGASFVKPKVSGFKGCPVRMIFCRFDRSRKFSVHKTTSFAHTDHNLRQLTKDLADLLMGVRLQIVTIISTIRSIKVETIRAIISLNPKQ